MNLRIPKEYLDSPLLDEDGLRGIHSMLGFSMGEQDAGEPVFDVREPTLVLSFMFFMGMNLAAIFCHNLTREETDAMWYAWAADVGFTGASSFSLILAALFQPFPTRPLKSSSSSDTKTSKTTPFASVLFFLITPILLSAAYLGIAHKETRPIAWTPEIVYLATTVLAIAVVSFRVLHPAHTLPSSINPVNAFGRFMLSVATAGIALGAGGLVADRVMCDMGLNGGAGQGWEWSLAHSLFAGCDVAFACLGLYVVFGVRRVEAGKKKKN
ncbi:hypothetical protein HK101_001838 [Irineochytrium annulatum]|nr:hypothetical protein HK101_001838 [Irineochytrium annulatum]